MAFCRWLSEQVGHEVSLPTEEEWERAARGRDGGKYPWGETYESGHANVDETWGDGEWQLDQTAAVGVYPQGASSEGVLDLSGNVCEWCLKKSEHPEQADGSGDMRVARGGSWMNFPDDGRGSQRYRNDPDFRHDGNGFRLVSSAPIR